MAEAEVFDSELVGRGNEVDDEEFGPEEDTLSEAFNGACEHVKSIVSLLTPSQMLEFYALFKQATVGPCNVPRPSWYAMEAKQKWDAWNKLGSMSKTDAMNAYIGLLQQFDSEVNKNVGHSKAARKSWISVSCMTDSDARVDDEDKTVYDWVKEGNLDKLRQCIRGRDVNTVDSEGLGLIHWAADRGNSDIIRFLVCEMKADIEMRDSDGQTAVHYAASCGHKDVLQFLIDTGADILVEDSEGLLPKDVAADNDIEKMLS